MNSIRYQQENPIFQHENPSVNIISSQLIDKGPTVNGKKYSALNLTYSDGSKQIFLKEYPENGLVSDISTSIGCIDFANLKQPKPDTDWFPKQKIAKHFFDLGLT
jgi:hypothetical protein